jgi:hypothetical protein
MSTKSDKGSGVSLSPELREVISRLKRKEPELQETVNRGGEQDYGREDNGTVGGRDSEDPS